MVDTKVPLSSICHNYNLYITLRGETEVGRAAIGLSSPSRTDRKEKRYGRLWPDKPSTDSHPFIPPTPRGDNRPGGRSSSATVSAQNPGT